MGSKNNPGKYENRTRGKLLHVRRLRQATTRKDRDDCLSKADPDEPMFVLLGRDPAAPILIKLWSEIRARMGEVQEKVDEAGTCAEACVTWLFEHGKAGAYGEALEICSDLHGLAPKVVVIPPQDQVGVIVEAQKTRIDELEKALAGCVDLITAWQNGIFKQAGITWQKDPLVLEAARQLLETRGLST